MKKHLALAVVAVTRLLPLSPAQDFQGAPALLKRLAEIAQEPPADPLADTPAGGLRRDLEKFRAAAPTLAPEVAAARWLALADRFNALSREEISAVSNTTYEVTGRAFDFKTVVAALPSPAAWDALIRAIEARPKAEGVKGVADHILRLVAHTLAENPAARWQDATALRAAFKKGSKDDRGSLRQLAQALLLTDPDPKHVLANFEDDLAALEKSTDNAYGQSLIVPDLVLLAGEPAAIKLLQRVLLLPNLEGVQFMPGKAVKPLARQLAKKLAPQLKSAPWQILDSADSGPLFEAMQKRFPAKSGEESSNRNEAERYYLLGLIIAKRNADAGRFAVAVDERRKDDYFQFYQSLDAAATAGHERAIFTFLSELLPQHPEMNGLWEDFLALAPQLGESEKVVAALRAALARENLPANVRLNLRERLAPALLAADLIEEGVRELQAILAAPRPKASEGDARTVDNRSSAAWELVRIGRLMERPEWIEAALAGARILQEEQRATGQRDLTLASMLVELGRLPEAEVLLIDAVVAASRLDEQRRGRGDSQALRELFRLYQKAGRSADVLALLDGASGWGVADLSDIQDYDTPTVVFAAATALAAQGRTADARRLVLADLAVKGGYDPAYALLLKLGGETLAADLDGLAARDRFEERPLIWKAQLQFDAGQLGEAEKTVRAAIAIDPSDGEQPKGDRLRAYAVLAAILEKKGDAAQAKILRGAVEAIRLSENADDWWQAGLLLRAVKMYDEALTLFADAYCIQSRLALRAAELGQMDKAEEHYRRAYELMPDSFGRVESHCFGCEHAFAGQRAQGLAEQVFTKLAAEPGAKPQVHYLLGYLRESQGRTAEALAGYRRAVELDPDYLNAWRKIADLGDNAHAPIADTNAAALNLIRLDPLGRHGRAEFNRVTDLKGLWAVAETAAKLRPPAPGALYPLAASKAALAGKQERSRGWNRNEEAVAPGELLAKLVLFGVANELLERAFND